MKSISKLLTIVPILVLAAYSSLPTDYEVTLAYARHRINLLKGGVELYELKADSKTDASRSLRRSAKAKSGLHSKIYIFDRKEVFIGSFNFDPRSANINAEVGIVYQIPEMANYIATTVFDDAVREFAYRVELEIKNESVFSILPIESQL